MALQGTCQGDLVIYLKKYRTPAGKKAFLVNPAQQFSIKVQAG